jgi:hypothetical protein
MPHATRDGRDYGAYQCRRYFRTEQEAMPRVAKYVAGAEKRVGPLRECRGGSRVGATAAQWAVARVYKFVLVSKKKVPREWYASKFDPDNNLRHKGKRS